MKKLVIALFLTLGMTGFSSAFEQTDFARIGVSAQIGEVDASGQESENAEITKGTIDGAFFGTGSFFIEKTLGFLPGPLGRLTIGFDMVPHGLNTGSDENIRATSENDLEAPDSGSDFNMAQAEFDNLNTIYLTANLTDWLYVKAGTVSVDMTTEESLTTGSAYGNASLDGEMYGFGVHSANDNGVFLRAEANFMEIDGVTLTSTTNSANKVTLDEIETQSLKISIGKAF